VERAGDDRRTEVAGAGSSSKEHAPEIQPVFR
jgi:hypothetical protein